jgi:carboxypeptidase C (cathepsin A)
MAGESYGGRYIPVFASAVYDQNAKLIEAGMTPINLTSIMIGSYQIISNRCVRAIEGSYCGW